MKIHHAPVPGSGAETEFSGYPQEAGAFEADWEAAFPAANPSPCFAGIDIGTTTLSVAVVSVESKRMLECRNFPNDSVIPSDNPRFHLQDADWIVNKVRQIVSWLGHSYSSIRSIGLTGQMHGIVYLNREGKAVSPLYTWQDERANEAFGEGTYCDRIRELTGRSLNAGYGFATHYYNVCNGLVSQDAVTFCTIMDYAAVSLIHAQKPVVHASNAASFGLFSWDENRFEPEALEKLGIDPGICPEVTTQNRILGDWHGVPVAVAIGDNQASVFGAVKDEAHSVLVNIGTGSQVSVITEKALCVPGLETRAYVGGRYLLCGCALCGGRAYSIVEKFFRGYLTKAGITSGSQYELMNELARQAYEKGGGLRVSTTFCGSREDPGLRGWIGGLDEANFTPENLILGTLQGIVDELWEFYRRMNAGNITKVVASGNGVRKNPVLQQLIRDRFGMRLSLAGIKEEAAFGCGLFSAVACGVMDLEEAKAMISSQEPATLTAGSETDQI